MNAPALADNAVHVWYVRLDLDEAEANNHRSVLNSVERERAQRFHFPADELRYVIAHGTLRQLLGLYTGRDPADLQFAASQHGKPSVAGAAIEFNLSHSGEMAAIAVCHRQVGIDIERLRPMSDISAMAARFLSPFEARSIEQLPEEARSTEFLRCWIRKEAYLKARGVGLSGLGADSAQAAEFQSSEGTSGTGFWRITELKACAGYVCALTAKSDCEIIEERKWVADLP